MLVVTPYLPSPPRFGGQQRMHALLSGLAARTELTLLSLVDPADDTREGLAATRAYCREVVTVPSARAARKRLWQLAASASPWSYERLTTALPALQHALDELLARRAYDLVQLEFVHTAGLSVRGRAAVCLDEHNVEYEILFRTARAASGALRRAYDALDGLKIRAEERAAWARVDGCALTSARDERTVLRAAPRARTVVVPNGVDVDFFRPTDPAAREPSTLLFFGAMDYFPNTDGALFFAREVLPLVVARRPETKLLVVGRRPPEAVTALRGANVEVLGAVDDLRPWLARATALVVPLRIGGGTRLKILEAMAAGKAVVSTSLGAEGLDVVRGRDLLVADGAAGLAGEVLRVLDSPDLATRLGGAARIAAQRYRWSTSVDRLAAFHDELVSARRAR